MSGAIHRQAPTAPYVRIDGPLSLETWMNGIKAQRTFGTTGPLVFFTVNGKGPGEEIVLGSGADVQVKAEAVSIAPMEKLEVIVNGRIAQTVKVSDPSRIEFDGIVPVPMAAGSRSACSARLRRYVSDSYAFAQTSPVYIVRGGRRWTSAVDARFLAQVVDALWARLDGQRARWRTPAEREKFKAAIDKARSVHLQIAGSNP